MRAWQIPLRLATGAYILNSGLEKWKADSETAEHLQGFAANAYPAVKRLEPRQFAKAVSVGEMAVGATLLSPFASATTAGLALGGFSGSLLNLYWKSPGLHRHHDPRPTPEGVALAKDSWMAGAALSLVLGSIGGSSRRKRKEAVAKAKAKATARAESKAATAAKLHAIAAAPKAVAAKAGRATQAVRRRVA
jgi:hypothetical protein